MEAELLDWFHGAGWSPTKTLDFTGTCRYELTGEMSPFGERIWRAFLAGLEPALARAVNLRREGLEGHLAFDLPGVVYVLRPQT